MSERRSPRPAATLCRGAAPGEHAEPQRRARHPVTPPAAAAPRPERSRDPTESRQGAPPARAVGRGTRSGCAPRPALPGPRVTLSGERPRVNAHICASGRQRSRVNQFGTLAALNLRLNRNVSDRLVPISDLLCQSHHRGDAAHTGRPRQRAGNARSARDRRSAQPRGGEKRPGPVPGRGTGGAAHSPTEVNGWLLLRPAPSEGRKERQRTSSGVLRR